MSNVSPAVDITKNLTYQQQGENNENNKILGEIENAILYGLTHPTANRWRETLVFYYARISCDDETYKLKLYKGNLRNYL